MTDALVCPVCANRPVLRALDWQGELRVPLRRCDGCHGVWTDAETAAVAAEHYHVSHYAMRPGHGRQRCRGCDVVFSETRRECPTCKVCQELCCVSCGKAMRLIAIAGVTLDVCVPCRGVWFDRGELGLIIYNHGRTLSGRLDAEGSAGAVRGSSGLSPVDWVPDFTVVDLAASAGESAVKVTSSVVESGGVEVVAVAGKVAVSAGEAVAEGASVAVEAVVDVISGIFSGF